MENKVVIDYLVGVQNLMKLAEGSVASAKVSTDNPVVETMLEEIKELLLKTKMLASQCVEEIK